MITFSIVTGASSWGEGYQNVIFVDKWGLRARVLDVTST